MTSLTAAEAKATAFANHVRRKLGARLREAEAATTALNAQLAEAQAAADSAQVRLCFCDMPCANVAH